VIGKTGHFWAAPFEKNSEFGGLGLPSTLHENPDALNIKFREGLTPGTNTTIAIIACDADLSKAETKRLAIAAHDGFARALWPAHTPLDGDLIFSLATGAKGKLENLNDWIGLCAIASATMSRAIARAIFSARTETGDLFPAWQKVYGSK
jgi:L-aminopeptidase/D-esterase-like protein